MKISVVIPLYNKAPYINRAIYSVLNQNYHFDELIVIDDGSTDHGGDLVKKTFGSSVKLLHQNNQGECSARNRGIAEARNEYIAFLDADDEWKPDFLKIIVQLWSNFPDCGAYATSAQIIKPNGQILYPNLYGIPPEPWMGIIPNFFELFQYGYAFNASSIVVPKKVLQEVGGFPDGVVISGDVATWIKIAIRYPIAFSPTRSILYHQEAENRVGNRYKLLTEMPYIKTIEDAILSGEISPELQAEAYEFICGKQIMVASQNIMCCNNAYAKNLLKTVRRTKKYRREWAWWFFWAHLPAGFPQKALKLKQIFVK